MTERSPTRLTRELSRDTVALHRDESCAWYKLCLDEAAMKAWVSFSCRECDHFDQPDDAPFARIKHIVKPVVVVIEPPKEEMMVEEPMDLGKSVDAAFDGRSKSAMETDEGEIKPSNVKWSQMVSPVDEMDEMELLQAITSTDARVHSLESRLVDERAQLESLVAEAATRASFSLVADLIFDQRERANESSIRSPVTITGHIEDRASIADSEDTGEDDERTPVEVDPEAESVIDDDEIESSLDDRVINAAKTCLDTFTASDIAGMIDVTPNGVGAVLGRLRKRGVVEKMGNGGWRLK